MKAKYIFGHASTLIRVEHILFGEKKNRVKVKNPERGDIDCKKQ